LQNHGSDNGFHHITMAHSTILGAERAPQTPSGHDIDALGPSDTSDSGSDVQGTLDFEADGDLLAIGGLSSDTDAEGTGERASAIASERVHPGADIAPDRIGSFDDVSPDDDLVEEADDTGP
jgi:hypothetical protein